MSPETVQRSHRAVQDGGIGDAADGSAGIIASAGGSKKRNRPASNCLDESGRAMTYLHPDGAGENWANRPLTPACFILAQSIYALRCRLDTSICLRLEAKFSNSSY